MLQTIRKHAQGWIAYVIIGLIIITFALWGINSYFNASGGLDVARVGDATISAQQFQRAYQNQLQQLPNTDPALLKKLVVQQLVNREVLLQAARREGLRVSDQRLREAIVALPVFQDDGRFSNERYEQMLRRQGLSIQGFEQDMRQSLLTEQLQQGIQASAFVTAADLERMFGLLNQQRELAYVVLPLAPQLEKAAVDDAAVAAYFEEHKDRFRTPEQVQVQYLELALDPLAASLPVREEDLRATYAEQSDRFRQPEQRSASYLLVTVAPEAEAAAVEQARARAEAVRVDIVAGTKTFDQAVQDAQSQPGMEAGSLGVIRRGTFEDPAFENALYALAAAGDVSEPVKTAFGFHLIRLDAITPERTRSFEEAREELAHELRMREAETRFYDLVERLSNSIYEHPDTLETTAAALGLPLQESPWISRQGGEGIFANRAVIDAAFSEEVLKRRLNSEPIELGSQQMIVLRIKEYKEAEPRRPEDVRDEIVKELRNHQAQEALRKNSEALHDRAKQGESLEALAKEFSGELKSAGLVGRRDLAKVDGAVLREAFRLAPPVDSKPAVGSATLGNGDAAVLTVSQIVPGKVEDVQEQERKALQEQLERQLGTVEFSGLVESLRRQADIVVNSDRL